MKKRKVSVEKNSGFAESFARLSVVNLQTTNTSQQRRSRSVKSPSVQNLPNSDTSDKFVKFEDNRTILPDEMQPPKTRFNSRSRSKEAHSTSSTRLKSFPAEKIKKLDDLPMYSPESIVQQDPREIGTFFAKPSARSNNGHGDAMPIQLSSHQQSKPQDTSDTNQQQFVDNHQQICQMSPLSESMPTQRIASPEKQTHNPSVPNVLQSTVVSDQTSQIPPAMINQPVVIQAPSTQAALSQTQQASSDSHAVIDRNCNEAFECEMQPVGDRNAVNHRQMQMQQPVIVQDVRAPLNDRSVNNYQNVYHTQLHAPCQQNPRQINEQMQYNAHHQQMLPQAHNEMQIVPGQQKHIHYNSGTCCGHYNQQLPAIQISEQGMTSPQDITVNQMKLMQHYPIHQQNFEYPVNLPSSWPQNDRWMQTANQNQQHLHQRSPPQWQYYYQMQDSKFHQQNFKSQDQPDPSQNQTNYKCTNQQSALEAHNQQDGGEKTLQFTPDMIHDQELLVSTMRQQRVPAEVMRRQFDALLNEQRKHLTYIAQFQQQEADISEVKKTRLARRRTEKDEKPEWMVHITPPRISYNEFERTKAQQRNSKEQCLMGDKSEEINKIMTDRQQNYLQQTKEEFANQVVPPQMYVQMSPQKLWQQQANLPYKNNHQTLCGYTTCYPYTHQQNAPNNLYRQPNPTFNEYMKHPYAVRYDPYCSERHKVWPKEYNSNSLNAIDNQKTSMDSARFYERNRRAAEPSSLLKMRMYKEVIRPQKRNNGLQDPDNIQKVLETLKNPTSKKGLEYLANLTKKKSTVRLNGTQEPNKIPEGMQPRPQVETSSQPRKKIPANGLANNRNLNNPPPRVLRPKRADEPLMMEYPRQRQNARIYNMQAEKENGMVATSQQRGYAAAVSHAQDARSISYDQQNASTAQGRLDDNAMVFQYGGAPPQHYHETQQYYLNGHNGGQGDVASMQRPDAPGAMKIDRAGGDTGEKPSAEEASKRMGGVQAMQRANAYGQPEIREARTIGGITYLVRKAEYAPNNLVVSPDKLIAYRHLQPPRIC